MTDNGMVLNGLSQKALLGLMQGMVDALTIVEKDARRDFTIALARYKESDDAKADFELALAFFEQSIISLAEARFTLEKVQDNYRDEGMQT